MTDRSTKILSSMLGCFVCAALCFIFSFSPIFNLTAFLLFSLFIFLGIGLFFYWILDKNYIRHIKPVDERIEALVHEKPAFLPSKSVLAIYKNIQVSLFQN
jgi:hypothetical protein